MSKACIDRSDSLIFQHKRRPRVTKNTNTKKFILGSHTRPLKFISAPLKAKHFIGQLWQLMTASNVGARTQAWQAKWAVFKIPGFVCKRFLPFFPTLSPLLLTPFYFACRNILTSGLKFEQWRQRLQVLVHLLCSKKSQSRLLKVSGKGFEEFLLFLLFASCTCSVEGDMGVCGIGLFFMRYFGNFDFNVRYFGII